MSTTGYAAAIDTNSVELACIPEDVWGVNPGTDTWQMLRLESEGFSGSKSRTKPNEMDSSGQSSKSITTKEESTGSINFSAHFGGDFFDNLLSASIGGGVFPSANSLQTSAGFVSSQVAISNSANRTCRIIALDAAFDGANFVATGQWIKLVSLGTPAQCGVARIKTRVGSTTLDLDCCSWVPVDTLQAAMGTCTFKSGYIVNGKAFQSYTVEKKLASNLFLTYAGAFPTGGSLDVGMGDYLKGTMSFLNKAEDTATVTVVTGTPSTITGPVINAIEGITGVWRFTGGESVDTAPALPMSGITKIGVKWSKEGAAAQYAMSTAKAIGMRSGKLLVSGSISMYFKDFAEYDAYRAETGGQLSFIALDGPSTSQNTKGYVITLPNVKFINPKIVAGGPGQDVMADFEMECNPETPSQRYSGKTIVITRFM